MGNNYSLQTLKVKSKMASQRMQAHQSKKENQLNKVKREIAGLLTDDKEQSARIKTEAVLREEDLIRVMEWLQMMCDLITTRIKQIHSSKECPTDLSESVCTILYCAKRIDVPELTEVGGQFKAKWGNKWFEANVENRSGRVSKQIVEKLSTEPPARSRVDKKLKEIADKFDIEWSPGDGNDEEDIQIVGHKNEYTVEFTTKPFGMEWTATEDGENLWVSNVTPMSPANKGGVVPGSMLIAFNGIDIQNKGGPSIHEKAATIGLPLRITFRKPSNLEAPKNKKDMSVREDVVNKCVKGLKNPATWDYTDMQKQQMCKKMGANAAEIASAIFLVSYIIEKEKKSQNEEQKMQAPTQPQIVYVQQPIQQPFNQQMQGPPQAYGQQQQYIPQQPMQPQYQQPMNTNMGMQPSQQQQQQQQPQTMMNGTPMGNGNNNNISPDVTDDKNKKDGNESDDEPPPGNNDDLDDLEKRFAALKNGL